MRNATLQCGVILFLMSYGLSLLAQSDGYKGAIGLRTSDQLAISGKLFISDDAALELIANIDANEGRPNTYTATYQKHLSMSSIMPRLKFYYGGGAALISVEDNSQFGLVGIVGIDYSSDSLPINVSIDIIPSLFFPEDDTRLSSNLGGISLRYTF